MIELFVLQVNAALVALIYDIALKGIVEVVVGFVAMSYVRIYTCSRIMALRCYVLVEALVAYTVISNV